MKLFIDTKSTVFLAGGAPAPVVDYETKRPKLDQASGEPLYAVQVIAMQDGGSDSTPGLRSGGPRRSTCGQRRGPEKGWCSACTSCRGLAPCRWTRSPNARSAAWVTSLTGRGLAPATVHKAYQLFAKTMVAAVDGGMLAQSPCRGVTLPKVEHEEMRYLNPAEIACLAEAIRPGYQALVFVGAYGGLRIGELAGLRRSRVDLDAGTVAVAETVVEVEGRLLFGPPKTRAGRRRIGLPRRVVDELALHLRAPGRPTDPVFRSPAGGPLRVTAFRNRIWRPATLVAGLPGLRIHDLRHTAVALWIAAGASPKEVAVRAGHTSTSFVLDRYGHLFPESDAALCERLDALFISHEDPANGSANLNGYLST